ncbi:MAG TPA: hypothetical protein VMT76_07170 [Puia sp.]|nr:hypothetical protein [Puia sp.]
MFYYNCKHETGSYTMNANDEEKSPFFKSWSYWYALVIIFLAILIIFFYFFTKHFS